jgi:hypothetical protein
MTIHMNDIPDGHREECVIPPAAAADATTEHVVFYAPFDCYVTSVVIIPGADVTGQDTNSRNLNLRDRGVNGGGTPSELANRDYAAGTNESAGVPTTLYSPASPGRSVSQNGVLSIQSELVGTGLALPSFRVIVSYRKR